MASAQTSKETRQPLDFYPTPEFYTRALLEHLPIDKGDDILCPFAGNGDIAQVLACHTGYLPLCNDLHSYGYTLDYMEDLSNLGHYKYLPKCEWVIDNPPYNLISNTDHVKELYNLATKGLCLLLRQTWYSAGTGQTGVSDRGRWLSKHPASMRITLPRYPFANNSKTGKPQTDACAHEWVIWDKTGKVFSVQNPVVTSETLEGWKWRKA